MPGLISTVLTNWKTTLTIVFTGNWGTKIQKVGNKGLVEISKLSDNWSWEIKILGKIGMNESKTQPKD